MSLEHHLAALLQQVAPLEPLDITLREAVGCQIVGDVRAPRPLPHFANAASAGYAVRSGDLAGPVALSVVDDVAPGFAATQPVYRGVTVRVAAGAPLPSGSDAVVPGLAVAVGDTVTLSGPVPSGAGVVAAGAFAHEGDVVLSSGTMVDSVAVGLLASLGDVRVSVRPRPRVVVVSIGNDLIDLGAPATSGLTYDAVGPMLAAAAEQAGADSFRVGPIPYEDRPIGDAIDDQLIRADLIVVVGPIDSPSSRIRQQLSRLGTVEFDEGSTSLGAFGHGTVGEDQVPVLALPAPAAAAAMLFAALAGPMIRVMRGLSSPEPIHVRLAAPVQRDPDVTLLLPGQLAADGSVTPVAVVGAGLPALVRGDVLLRILPGAGTTPAGTVLPALPLRTP